MSLQNRTRRLATELGKNPFLPLLFLSEAIKETTLQTAASDFQLQILAVLWGLSVGSVVSWIYFHEEIEWGIEYVEEKAEEIEDDTK